MLKDMALRSALCIPPLDAFLNICVRWIVGLFTILRSFADPPLSVIPASDPAAKGGVKDRSDNATDSVLLIDTSYSMDEEDWPPSRLDGAKIACTTYVKRFLARGPGARVAIVAFNEQATVMCPLTGAHQRDDIMNAIEQLSTGSCTNVTSGLGAAESILTDPQRPAKIVVLSDGAHNTGPLPDSVAAALRERAIVECVGIADREAVDEVLMKSIASSYPDGTKRYRWIGDPEGLDQHLDDLAGGIMRS